MSHKQQQPSSSKVTSNQSYGELGSSSSSSSSVPDPSDDDPFIAGKNHLAISDSNVETTPSTRANKENSMSLAAKARVNKATAEEKLAGTRCIMENTSVINEVEYAHCYRRSTESQILDNLECAWGMKYRTLNLDTRYNVFRLSAKFHALFDKGLWILLPHADIINMYLQGLPTVPGETKKPKKLPDLIKPPYEYTIIPHTKMQAVPLFRQTSKSINKKNKNSNSKRMLTIKDFDFISYPFSDITIFSHVHPRYVICSIGYIFRQRLRKTPEEAPFFRGYPESAQGTIENIMKIYTSWTTLYDKHYDLNGPAALSFAANASQSAKSDNNTSRTASMRIPSKRPRQDSQSSGVSHGHNLRSQQSNLMLNQHALAK